MNRSLPFALSLAFIVLIGCASSSVSSRESLSDAMRAASDENGGNREADAPSSMPQYRTEDEDAPIPTAHRPHLGIGLGSGMLSSGDLFGMSEFFVSWAFKTNDQLDISAYLAFQDVPLQKTSSLNESLDGGLFFAGIGGDVRWYRTPHFTFIGHYLSAGAAFYGLFWEYKNEIELPAYDEDGFFTGYERVKRDVLGALDLHGGIGLDLGQVWDVHLEGELSPGVVFGLGRTLKGFDNDVFKPFLYLKLRVAVRLALPI